jgi:HK97 family phage prohead protease
MRMKKQEPKFKTFRAECKAGEEPGVIDAFIPMSVGTVDRDEELIVPTAYEKTIPIFMKRPVLVSSHAYSDLRKQIGEFKEIKIKGKGVFAKPKYYVDEGNEEADWGYNLALHNMAAYSVGFIPKKWTDGKSEKEPRRTYTEVELLEISQVVVPSNRDAIQGLRSKAFGVEAALLDDVLESDLIEMEPEEKAPEAYPLVTAGFATCDYGGDILSPATSITVTDAATSAEYTAPGITTAGTVVAESKVTEGDIADDLDEIATYFEQGGTLTKDNYSYAWKVINALRTNAGPNPEDIQPIDIVAAARAAVAEILGGK